MSKKQDLYPMLEARGIDFLQAAATLLPHRIKNLHELTDHEVADALIDMVAIVKEAWCLETVGYHGSQEEDIEMQRLPEASASA